MANEPTDSGSTPQTDAERNQLANELVDRFSLWSGAAGLIPIPLVDMAAVGGVQLQMLRRLSEIFGVPFSANRGKSIIASLAGAIIPASTATTTAMIGRCCLLAVWDADAKPIIAHLMVMHGRVIDRHCKGQRLR